MREEKNEKERNGTIRLQRNEGLGKLRETTRERERKIDREDERDRKKDRVGAKEIGYIHTHYAS